MSSELYNGIESISKSNDIWICENLYTHISSINQNIYPETEAYFKKLNLF